MLCISLLKENMIRASSSSQFLLMAIWLMAIWLMCAGFAYNVYAQDDIYIEKNEGAHVLRWNSEEGTTSFLQRSTDLIRWDYMLHYDVGDGSERVQEPDQEAGAEGQGLSFYRLQLYPTNLDDPDDTDGDGLHNLFELGHGYLPVLTDSDDDGVADGDEDLDEDGESNLTEIANGTDASDSSSNSGDEDFDEDGLSNKEESAIGTDPNRPDTDGDDIIDSQDGWPLCKELAPERLRRPKYAVISVKELESDETVTFFETNNNARALLTTYKSSNRSRPSYYYKTDAANPLIELPSSYTNSSGMISYHIYKSLNEANYFLRNPASGDNGNLYLEGDLIVTLASPESLPHDIGGFGNFDEPDGYPVTVNLTGQTYGTGSSQEYVDDTDDYTQYSYGQINYTAPILWSIAGQSSQLSPAIKHRFEPNGTGIGGGYALQGGRYDSGTFLAKIDKLNNNHIGLASQKVIDDYWYTFYPDDSGGSIITNFGAWFDSAFSLLLPNHNGVLSPVLHSTHLSNKNTVMAGQGSDTIIWLDQTAGLQNDQAVTGTPNLKKVTWLDSWGPTPPINLNAKMQGFESNGSRIWHNSLWLDIADIVPESDWTDIKIKDINDHGMLAAEATNAEGKKCAIFLLPVEIVPDYNRDGMISDADRDEVTEEDPFRWWVNDDDDQGLIRSKGSHNDIPGDGTADYTDLKVDGLRDVIDFFPLYLDIKALLSVLPKENYTYKLSHEDSAFKFGELPNAVLEGDPDLDGVGAYIRELSAAQEVAELSLQEASADGAVISEAMLDAFKQSRGVLILEATKETEKPLWLKIFKGSELLGEVSFPVKTSGVEKMFRCKNLVSASGAQATEANRMGEPTNYPDDLTNDKAFFMVHGYEPELDSAGNQKDARGFNAEIFKRLHQSGSRAKFVGVTWNGATGKDYHQAVINAFKTSGSMKGVAEEMGGNDVVVAAHSLGNVVTSNAISHEGFSPTHYFMVNAAVPIEAYDPGQTDGTGKQAEEMAKWMTHDKWKPYYGLGLQKLFAAEWHKLFSSDDNRRKLTWKGRFSEVVPVAYNFYSSGEDVLENPNDQETVWKNLGTVIVRWLNGSGTGRHAWVSQEMAKGSDLASLIFLKRNHAGWKINFSNFDLQYTGYPIEGNYYSFFAEQAKLELEELGGGRLNDENLAQVGFFWQFRLYDQAGGGEEKQTWKNLYGPIVDGNLATGNGFTQPNAVTVKQSSDEAERPEVQAELLASAIPAMSYAAGANNTNGTVGFDMESDFKVNGWPLPGELGRGGLEEEYQGDWLHSDFWVVAPVYVQSVYLKWVELAKLDKE